VTQSFLAAIERRRKRACRASRGYRQKSLLYLIPRNVTICNGDEEPGEDCIEDAHRTYVVRLWSKSEQGWCFVIRWEPIPNTTRPLQGRAWKKYVECKDLIHLPQSPPPIEKRRPLERKI
jgi:hypothetical protein